MTRNLNFKNTAIFGLFILGVTSAKDAGAANVVIVLTVEIPNGSKVVCREFVTPYDLQDADAQSDSSLKLLLQFCSTFQR